MADLPRNPLLDAQGTYPFVRLNAGQAARRRRAASRSSTSASASRARRRRRSSSRRSSTRCWPSRSPAYPLAVGLPELREAAAHWVHRRFGAQVDPDRRRHPDVRVQGGDLQRSPRCSCSPGAATSSPSRRPATPSARAARTSRAPRSSSCRLTHEHGWLPGPRRRALGAPRAAVGQLARATRPARSRRCSWLAEAAARCREHGVVLASDEAYCELYFGDPPPSALQVADHSGDPRVPHALQALVDGRATGPGSSPATPSSSALLRRFRPSLGTAPQAFVQRASVAAWDEESHVDEARARYAAKRDALLPALREAGLEHVGGDASFFLWMRVPDGDDEGLAARWLEHGVVGGPRLLPRGGRRGPRAASRSSRPWRRASVPRSLWHAWGHDPPLDTDTDLVALAARIEELYEKPTSDLTEEDAATVDARHRPARRRPGPRRRADDARRARGRSTSGPRRPCCSPSARAGWRPSRRARTSTTTSSPLKTGYAARGVRVVPPGDRAPRRLPRARRGAHALAT